MVVCRKRNRDRQIHNYDGDYTEAGSGLEGAFCLEPVNKILISKIPRVTLSINEIKEIFLNDPGSNLNIMKSKRLKQ